MTIIRYLNRISYIDYLIRTRSTGTSYELSKKLNISKRMTFEYLSIMKEMGAPIRFSQILNSYVYDYEVKFKFGFFVENKFSCGK